MASAEADLEAARYSAAGLAAIHSGISACDAALIGQTGLRSSSQNHAVVLDLLDERVDAFSAAQRRQLTGLIKMKNVVAYEQRPLTEVEAMQLVDQARRLTRWSARLVPPVSR